MLDLQFQGAIAGSAPIAQFTSPCDAFGRIVTSDFSAAAVNSSCSTAIRKTFINFSCNTFVLFSYLQ